MKNLFRLIRSPPGSVLLLLVLVASVHQLLEQEQPRTPVVRWLGGLLQIKEPGQGWAVDMYLVRENGELRIIDTEGGSSDELIAISTHQPDDLIQARVVFSVEASGFWATTGSRTSYEVIYHSFGRPPTEEEVGTMYGLIGSHLGKAGAVNWPEFPATGTFEERSTVVGGYAHNVLAAIALVLFVYSIGWVRDIGAWRARRRLSRGRCPVCTYEISDLQTCPECGATLNSNRR